MTYDTLGNSLLRMSTWFKGFAEEYKEGTKVSKHTTKQMKHNDRLPIWFRKIVSKLKYDSEVVLNFNEDQMETLSKQCSDR